jgi:hypothetical protein
VLYANAKILLLNSATIAKPVSTNEQSTSDRSLKQAKTPEREILHREKRMT